MHTVGDVSSDEVSLHASNEVINKLRRVHITLEFSWSPEGVIEGVCGVLRRVLTIIAPCDIESKEIPYCQAQIALIERLASTTHAAKWAKFWAYFGKIWLRLYDISDWNVYDL